MKERAWRLSLCLWLVCFAPALASSQATERAELLPDGSVLLSPQALSDIDSNLTLLENNLARQRQLSQSLTGELSAAETSLTTLKSLYNEQVALIGSLRIQWTLIAERLSESDQSLAWAMEDAALMEVDLTTALTANQRLDRSARVWRVVAIVAGCLAVGAGVAAVVW